MQWSIKEMNLWLNVEFQFVYSGNIREDQRDGQEGKETEILQRRGEDSRPSHEETQSRYTQERKIRQEGQEQAAGDRDWAFGSPKERGQGPEEAVKEIIITRLAG